MATPRLAQAPTSQSANGVDEPGELAAAGMYSALIAGLVVLLLLAVLCAWLHHRRKHRAAADSTRIDDRS